MHDYDYQDDDDSDVADYASTSSSSVVAARMDDDTSGPDARTVEMAGLLRDLASRPQSVVRSWPRIKELAVDALISNKSDHQSIAAAELLEAAALALAGEDQLDQFDVAICLYQSLKRNMPASCCYAGNSDRRPKLSALRLLRLVCVGADGDFHAALQLLSESELLTPEVANVVSLHEVLFTGKYSTFDAIAAKIAQLDAMSGSAGHLRKLLRKKVAYCLEAGHDWLPVPLVQKLLMLDSREQLMCFIRDSGNAPAKVASSTEGAALLDGDAPLEEEAPSYVEWDMRGDKIFFKRVEEKKKPLASVEILTNFLTYATELDRIV